jgi:hypothetical protein
VRRLPLALLLSAIGIAMHLQNLNLYELANEWSGWLATGAGIAVFALVLKLAMSIAKKLPGLPALKRRARSPKRRRAAPVQAVVIARPDAAEAAADAQWQAVSDSLGDRADHLRTIGTLQTRAGTCVEAAEYALDRLLADCAAVALTPDSMDLQRLRAAIAAMPAAAEPVAAASTPLAA